MTEIAANTVDVEVHVYESPHKDSYRWSVRPDPDSPGTVNLSHEELAFYDNQTRCGYEKRALSLLTRQSGKKSSMPLIRFSAKQFRRNNDQLYQRCNPY